MAGPRPGSPVWLKKLVMGLVGRPLLRELEKSSRDARRAQEAVLRGIVASARDTAFGRDHGFATIASAEDFGRQVPVRDFEGHRPYVDRMCNGEADVLFPGRPLSYNTTSGTTNKPKLIPVSREYFDFAYTRLNRLWFYSTLRDNPAVFNGRDVSAVGAAVEGRVADGTPYGSISGNVYRNTPGILRDMHSFPYPVLDIQDYRKKYYAIMRFGLAADVSYIVAANPSSVLQLHRVVMENFADLVRDIHDGALRPDIAALLPGPDRAAVIAGMTPDPRRARSLEQLMNLNGDRLRPRHYWPNLACINTWKQGNCGQILSRLDGYFPPHAVIREFGYQASEARAGLVLGNDWEHSVLACHVYYFEFIEESQRGSASPAVLRAHELEPGKRYYILITNGSGLYRYDMNDLVEARGRYNDFPLVTFIRKGEGCTSLTGEKLTEPQVTEAVRETARSRGAPVEYFTMFCDEIRHAYLLFVEFAPGAGAQQRMAFCSDVDEYLCGTNPEYEAKRHSGRLAAPSLRELPPASYEKVKELAVSRGLTREGQYKALYLQRRPEMLEIFDFVAGEKPGAESPDAGFPRSRPSGPR